jgi:hypothetical protein
MAETVVVGRLGRLEEFVDLVPGDGDGRGPEQAPIYEFRQGRMGRCKLAEVGVCRSAN